jgi:NADPH:quinone reductase-like Zn-dependent oxidoreductase
VRIRCFGINRMDLSQRNGTYQVPPQAGPILGVEFSGIVTELGPPSKVEVAERAEGHAKDVFKPGDKVFGLAYGGKPRLP